MASVIRAKCVILLLLLTCAGLVATAIPGAAYAAVTGHFEYYRNGTNNNGRLYWKWTNNGPPVNSVDWRAGSGSEHNDNTNGWLPTGWYKIRGIGTTTTPRSTAGCGISRTRRARAIQGPSAPAYSYTPRRLHRTAKGASNRSAGMGRPTTSRSGASRSLTATYPPSILAGRTTGVPPHTVTGLRIPLEASCSCRTDSS